jgi:hypothetical protein
MNDHVAVFSVYLPDFAYVVQLIGLVILFLLVRTALKLTPWIW